MTRRELFAAAAVSQLSPCASGQSKPELVSARRIWDRAEYNSFTDLIRVRNRWFCVFREGHSHAGDHGKVRIITSADAQKWEPAALVEEAGIDLRDPKLSEMPDGRLMLITGGIVYEGTAYATRAPRVSFSADGHQWSAPRRLLSEDHWLWRVTWRKNRAYSLSKLNEGRRERRGFLYSSENGIDWQWITEFKVEGVSETTLRFLPDDEAIALIRPGWIGSSRPPYKQWKFHKLEMTIGGPNFLILPDGRFWATARDYLENGTHSTVLAEMTRESYRPVLTLPSGGDTSYAGMVWYDDLLWISYYSSHEEKTSVYLATVRFR